MTMVNVFEKWVKLQGQRVKNPNEFSKALTQVLHVHIYKMKAFNSYGQFKVMLFFK